MEEVVATFMNKGDKDGLTLLYEITNDEFVKLALDWYISYEEIQSNDTNEYAMYDDLMGVIWHKYELNRI